MIQAANEKWEQSRLIARPAFQFRGFFSAVSDPKIAEIAQEIKATYNDYLKKARSLEELKQENPELIDPYIEVTSTKSQRTIYLTRIDRFRALESALSPKDKLFSLDCRLVNNTLEREIPNSLLPLATVSVDGKPVECPIGAVAISSVEAHNLKGGMKLTQGLAAIQPGITQERSDGIYRALDEYVDRVRQEHPPSERQALAAALWHHAHTRDEYQTKKALLAFKLFPDEVVKQLEELQFRDLKVVGLHFPTNEYGNRQWRGEEVDCEIAVTTIPERSGQWSQKRVIKVEGKVLAPLTSESPALAVGTRFQASILAQGSSGVIATTPEGNTLKIGQIKNFAYRERYQAYASDVLKNSALIGSSRQEIDIRVAIRAYADGKESQEVVAILSQSEHVLQWRATVPHALSWDEYVRQAKEYVRVIQNEAYERFQRQQPEKLKLQEISR